MDITATQPVETPIFKYTSTSQYGVMYGFAVENDKIYIADGGDFASNGKAYVYSLTGSRLRFNPKLLKVLQELSRYTFRFETRLLI